MRPGTYPMIRWIKKENQWSFMHGDFKTMGEQKPTERNRQRAFRVFEAGRSETLRPTWLVWHNVFWALGR